MLQRKQCEWSSLLDAERSGEQAEGVQPQEGCDAAHRAVVGVNVHARLLRGVRVDAQVALYVAAQWRQHGLLQRPQNLIVVGLHRQQPVSLNLSVSTCIAFTLTIHCALLHI